MKITFTKMQALGNDVIIIDTRRKRLKNLPRLSKTLCDRRFGIGADQLLLLDNSKKADFKMRTFNADGSEVEMCGNGIRCLAKYIWDETGKWQMAGGKRTKKHPEIQRLSIETSAGIIIPERSGKNIKVDMGEPVFEPGKIPVLIDKKTEVEMSRKQEIKKLRREEVKNSQLPSLSASYLQGRSGNTNFVPIIDYPFVIGGMTFTITCVSMGNPHAVIVASDIKKVPLNKYGPLIETHRLFPRRTNVEFIQVMNRKNIKMRVWERGAGETLACGTGASAAGVASYLLGHTDRKVRVDLPGGRLLIEWSAKDNHVYMTGPAVNVFDGTIDTRIASK
jgi:diaminopimelate epimerase